MEKKLRKVQRKQQQCPNMLFYSFMFQVVTVQRKLLRATGSVIKAPLNVHYNSVPGNSLCTESCHMFQLLQLVNGPQWQSLTCPPTILTSCIFDKLSSSADGLKTARGLCTNLRLWNLHMLLFSHLIKHTTEPVFVEHISLVVCTGGRELSTITQVHYFSPNLNLCTLFDDLGFIQLQVPIHFQSIDLQMV